jgi:hypothetical protein
MLTIPTLTLDQMTDLDRSVFDATLLADQTLWQQWINEAQVRLSWALVVNLDA